MDVLVYDVETTHTDKPQSGTSALPFIGNRLVSIGWKWLGSDQVYYDCYYHSTEPPTEGAFQDFQDALTTADVVVGQNIKFDLIWIKACGFKHNCEVYDTMVAEYILSKSQRWPLNLDALSKKYADVKKEKDLVADYLKDGITFYDIPWDIIKKYGTADVIATEQVALKQMEAFGSTFEELYNGKGITADSQAIV